MLGRREINKLIVAQPGTSINPPSYRVRHRIPGEEIICEVPSLDIAACIVKALRERQALIQAQKQLAKHMKEQEAKRGNTKGNKKPPAKRNTTRQLRRSRRR